LTWSTFWEICRMSVMPSDQSFFPLSFYHFIALFNELTTLLIPFYYPSQPPKTWNSLWQVKVDAVRCRSRADLIIRVTRQRTLFFQGYQFIPPDPFFSPFWMLFNRSMFRHANEGDKLISISNWNNSRINFKIVDREIKSRNSRSIIFSNLSIKIFNLSSLWHYPIANLNFLITGDFITRFPKFVWLLNPFRLNLKFSEVFIFFFFCC
jgi:hypothetical protein